MKSAKLTILVLLLAAGAWASTENVLPTFQHIIVIVQENRTPDNLFGSNPRFAPGVDIQQPPSGPWCLGACFDPGHRHLDWENEYQQSWRSCPGTGNARVCTAHATYCNNQQVGKRQGQMHLPSCPQQTYVSSTYDNSVVSPYFEIATKYGFANYFFQTNQGPSMPAHLFLFSGTSAPVGDPTQQGYNFFQAENPPGGRNNEMSNTGCTAPASQTVPLIDPSGREKPKDPQYNVYPCFSDNSLPTLLDASHTSWRYYTNERGGTTNGIWNAPAAIQDICMPVPGGKCTGVDYINDVVVNNPTQVLLDLGTVSSQDCGLRNVSWVIPNGNWSDHPGFSGSRNRSTQIEGGPAWVADIINAVGNGPCTDTVNGKAVPYWQDTAIFVVWDDWGGFWDHVPPYEVLINTQRHPCNQFGCGYVSGFRVPLLVVSAYTGTKNPDGSYSGYVSGDTRTQGKKPKYTHDFGSILAFIENNFNLGIGNINLQYPFADAIAPDRVNGTNIPLSDFFPLTSPRPFQAITLPAAAPGVNSFINYNGPIEDPDNDVIDND